MFNLITTYYESNNDERQTELNECLIHNLNNNFIKKIYLLNDKIYDFIFLNNENISKIIQVEVDEDNKKRLGYDFSIKFINENIPNEKCILSNSDIFFDTTLDHLETYDLNNKVLALSRYNEGVLYDRHDSQDSWIFISPLNIDLNLCNFKFGTRGCDNSIAYTIKESGYDILNPSKTIITHHVHKTEFRTYPSNVVPGPYHMVKIGELIKDT